MNYEFDYQDTNIDDIIRRMMMPHDLCDILEPENNCEL